MKSFITLLNQTTLELFGEPDMNRVAKGFTKTGIKILNADFGFVWLKSTKSTDPYILAYKSPRIPYEPRFPRPAGINSQVAKNRFPFFATKIPKERDLHYDVSPYM